MDSDKNTPRFLGAAFFIVAVTSALSAFLFMSVVGSGGISDILVRISGKVTLMRVSILLDLVTSVGIVVLAVLLYVVLKKQNSIIALVALGWWLAEAIMSAVSKIGAFALIPLSLEFVKAGSPDPSYYQTLGNFLYYGVSRTGYDILMLFYCLGGILWYSLFYRSRFVPRIISLWGLVAVSVGVVGMLFIFFGYDVSIFVFLPILPFEITIGLWLSIKGIKLS